jgi:hypothetical protein
MTDSDSVHGPFTRIRGGGGGVTDTPLLARWSIAAPVSLTAWPWQWKPVAPIDRDPGPGKRWGYGSVTVLPYVIKSFAGRLRPGDPPAGAS